MTTKTSRSSRVLAAELSAITADLEEARKDMALLERLKSAADRVTRLTAEQTKTVTARDAALVTEAKVKQEARFAGIEQVEVTDNTPNDNVVRSSFTISYVRPTWDGRSSVPRQHTVNGFALLVPEVLDYLIERCPERIPAKITALAPEDIRLAFNRYFVSVRRGYVAG